MTPPLLEPDGSATPVTTFLLVHRALRRDLARFPQAVRRLPAGDTAQAQRLVDHWGRVRGALDGHHAAEDERLFPALLAAEPALADVMEVLDGQHAALDGALATIESALARLPDASTASEPSSGAPARGPGTATARAAALLDAFADVLDGHLALEEEHLVPVMRRTPGMGAPPAPGPRPGHGPGPGPGTGPAGQDGGAGATQGWLLAWGAEGLDRRTLDAVLAALPPTVAQRAPALMREHDSLVRAVWRDVPGAP